MENDSDSICFIGKTLLRSPNSSFDKSDSLSIPNLLFTLDDVTYHRKCFQKQKPLPQCDTLREIDTFVSAHRSNFFIYLFFCCWRVKLWQTVLVLLWQNSRVPPSKNFAVIISHSLDTDITQLGLQFPPVWNHRLSDAQPIQIFLAALYHSALEPNIYFDQDVAK